MECVGCCVIHLDGMCELLCDPNNMTIFTDKHPIISMCHAIIVTTVQFFFLRNINK